MTKTKIIGFHKKHQPSFIQEKKTQSKRENEIDHINQAAIINFL